MIIQSTDIEFPHTSTDNVIAAVSEGVIPTTTEYAGFKAGIWALDRRAGKILNLNVWDSDATLAKARADTVQTLGGKLDDYGVIDLGHRRFELAGYTSGSSGDGRSGIVHALRTEYSSDRENEVLTALREEIVPLTKRLVGFQAGIWGVDRRACTVVNFNVWADDDAPVKARAELAKTVGNTIHDRTEAVDAALDRYELIGFVITDP